MLHKEGVSAYGVVPQAVTIERGHLLNQLAKPQPSFYKRLTGGGGSLLRIYNYMLQLHNICEGSKALSSSKTVSRAADCGLKGCVQVYKFLFRWLYLKGNKKTQLSHDSFQIEPSTIRLTN